MDPLWSLEVEGFGRIAHARIEQAPLIVLVGKNNSGKSYMASLLWGLMNINSRSVQRFSGRVVRSPQWFFDRFREFYQSSSDFMRIDGDHVDFRDCLEGVVRLMGDLNFHRYIMSDDEFSSGRVVFSPMSRAVAAVTVRRSDEHGDRIFSLSDLRNGPASELELRFNGKRSGVDYYEPLVPEVVNEYVIERSIGLPGVPGLHSVLYIPAARTGLMLALRSLISDLLNSLTLIDDDDRSILTVPTVDFLQHILKTMITDRSGFSEIAHNLETRVLDGSFCSTELERKDFRFRSSAANRELPLHVASSMVTELAPFLLLLRSQFAINGFVFEEPEAHLHLSAQREMARALVKIVNMGIPVVITTHSDTFVQQINLLMHLHGHKRRDELMAKFGYEANETLDPEKARAYEFVDDGSGRTVARELTKEEEGFVVPSLNETLADLAKELYEFDKS